MREWDRDGDEQLPPRVELEVQDLIGTLLIVGKQTIEDILGHGDDSITVVGNLAFQFQRYPGDPQPFLAVGSYPDDERIAFAFIKRINRIMEERGLGSQ